MLLDFHIRAGLARLDTNIGLASGICRWAPAVIFAGFVIAGRNGDIFLIRMGEAIADRGSFVNPRDKARHHRNNRCPGQCSRALSYEDLVSIWRDQGSIGNRRTRPDSTGAGDDIGLTESPAVNP